MGRGQAAVGQGEAWRAAMRRLLAGPEALQLPASRPTRPGAALVAGVLAAHALLLGAGMASQPPQRPGPPVAGPVLVRWVAPAPPVPQAPPAPAAAPVGGAALQPFQPPAARLATAAPTTATSAAIAPPAAPTAPAADATAPADRPAAPAAPPTAPDGRRLPAPADAAAAVLSASAPAAAPRTADSPPPVSSPALTAGAPWADDPPAHAGAAADALPPVYPTRLPPPGQWRFRLQQPGGAAEAVLDWQHDGQRYRLRFEATAAGRPVVQQASEGALGAAGLGPERFVDRRRGRSARAVNLDAAAGLARFSATEVTAPAWAATQDRLGWLLQLAAVAQAAAAAGQPLPEVLLHVVDARGGSGLWRFVALDDGPVDTPAGPRPARAFRHDPPQPDGLRLEVWLDPAEHHRPLRLRQTVLRTGAVTEWLPAAP